MTAAERVEDTQFMLELNLPFIERCAQEPMLAVDLYCEIVEQFKEIKIDLAYSYAQLLSHILDALPYVFSRVDLKSLNTTETVIKNKIKEIQMIYKRLCDREREMESKDYWDETNEDKEKKAKLSYKKLPDSSLKILSTFSTKANLFNFLALINEVDLYPLWVPFSKKSFIVSRLSHR